MRTIPTCAEARSRVVGSGDVVEGWRGEARIDTNLRDGRGAVKRIAIVVACTVVRVAVGMEAQLGAWSERCGTCGREK